MPRTHESISLRADWMNVIEVAYAPARDDQEWAANVSEAARPIFPRADVVGFYAVGYSPDLSTLQPLLFSPPTFGSFRSGELSDRLLTMSQSFGNGAVFGQFHFQPSTVLTNREVMLGLDNEIVDMMSEQRRDIGLLADGLGVVTHPTPGVVAALFSLQDSLIELRPYERKQLARLGLHLEAAFRARRNPENIRAELTKSGRIVSRDTGDGGVIPTSAHLQTQTKKIQEARSKRARASVDALDLWSALLEGRVSVIPRVERGEMRYLVLENPPSSRGIHALTPSESAVLSLSARGLSTKLVAYGLGLSSSTVSDRLASAASKVGVASRAELVRIAAILACDPRADAVDESLTSAEREILQLLQEGLSNHQIAKRRSRSVRTIANQVASLLRKTNSPSRRALVVSRSA